jgi:site-specific recombinase XerD
MTTNPEQASNLDDAVEAFLDAKQKGEDSGNYRALAANVLSHWNEWLHNRDIDSLDRVDSQTMRRYAQRLRQRARARESNPETGITPATAQTYYAIISGFLTWCVEDERIPTNPALARRAKSELSEDTGERTTQQFWSDEDRTRLLRFVDQRVHDAIDEKGSEATTEVRDRALVRVLAFSGCRSAEIARDTRDTAATDCSRTMSISMAGRCACSGKPKNGRTPNFLGRPTAHLTATTVSNSRQQKNGPSSPPLTLPHSIATHAKVSPSAESPTKKLRHFLTKLMLKMFFVK